MTLKIIKINSIIITFFTIYLFWTPPNLALPFFFGKYVNLHYVFLISLLLLYLIINNFKSIRSKYFFLTFSFLLFAITTFTNDFSIYGQIVKLLFSLIIVLNVDYKSLDLGLHKSVTILSIIIYIQLFLWAFYMLKPELLPFKYTGVRIYNDDPYDYSLLIGRLSHFTSKPLLRNYFWFYEPNNYAYYIMTIAVYLNFKKMNTWLIDLALISTGSIHILIPYFVVFYKKIFFLGLIGSVVYYLKNDLYLMIFDRSHYFEEGVGGFFLFEKIGFADYLDKNILWNGDPFFLLYNNYYAGIIIYLLFLLFFVSTKCYSNKYLLALALLIIIGGIKQNSAFQQGFYFSLLFYSYIYLSINNISWPVINRRNSVSDTIA